jgi:hypothetical protein
MLHLETSKQYPEESMFWINVKCSCVSSKYNSEWLFGKAKILLEQRYLQMVLKIKQHCKENWGLPFIGAFIFLLSVAAVTVALGWTAVAEAVGNVAYFTLLLGVVLQFVQWVNGKRKCGERFL